MEKITYWLYSDGKPIATVREIPGQSDNTIRGIAIAQAERHPTVYADYPSVDPQAHRERLRYAEVRVYEDEGPADWTLSA